jgi:type II secretory pathway predicted ATPase ExeA
MALITKPGMGKTTLLFQLLERLEGTARTAFLFQTQCNVRELFRYLLSDLGIDAHDQDLVQMHERLNQVLIRDAEAGLHFVLVIDEAQNLDETVLESVRLLSDFETPRTKLMQIVLAGQPQLADKLARPELAQLRQRVSILSRIEPLSSEEINRYIEHRLKVAGHSGGSPFEPDALALIAAESRGIPRTINNLCFNALTLGYALKKKTVDSSIVKEVLSDLELDRLKSEPPAPLVLEDSPSREEEAVTPLPADPPSEPPPVEQPSADGAGPSGAERHVLKLSPAPSPALSLDPGPAWVRRLTQAPALRSWAFRIAAMALLIAAASFVSVALYHRHGSTQNSPEDASAAAKKAVPAPGTITVVVEPGQTLDQISRQHLGRFDSKLLKEILRLNPGLRDPNRIEVGDRILLPGGPFRPELSRRSRATKGDRRPNPPTGPP